MKRFVGATLALGLIGLAAPALSHAADLAAYGKLPNIEDIDLSPDGKTLAEIVSDGQTRLVVAKDIDSGRIVMTVNAGATKARYLEWADNQNIILALSRTTNPSSTDLRAETAEYYLGVVMNITTSKSAALLSASDIESQRLAQNNESMNVLLSAPVPRVENGETIVYVTGVSFDNDGQGVPSVFRVDLKHGQKVVYRGPTPVADYLIDQTGKVFAQATFADRTATTGLALRSGGGLKAINLPGDFDGDLSLLGFTTDGGAVLVSYKTKGDRVVAEVTPDGAWTPRPDLDGLGLLFDRSSQRYLGSLDYDAHDNPVYHFADPADQRNWRAIVAAFPGERVRFESFSADHKRALVLSDSPTDGPAYAVIDLVTGKGNFVGSQYAGLKASDISPVRAISFKAADGLELAGYLTTPASAGKDPKGLPLVVLAHGGPASRDTADFDWWSQALASQGYAVLRVNFRGSSGYGDTFTQAGFGEWGRKMQTDLSDGVRYAAAQGWIDPNRVCIVGASYGGYAALAGATLDKGVYRCAASVAGPADLHRMLLTDQVDGGFEAMRYWTRFMGVKDLRDPALDAISPAAHAADVTIPILLIHGKDDTVVQYEQSQIMADALKKAGKPFEFVTLDGEDHWLSSGATRLKMLQSVVTFLQKNNPVN